MSEYRRAETIDEFVEKIHKGIVGFSTLRQSLAERGIENDEINIIVKQVDSEVQNLMIKDAVRNRGKNMFIGGVLILTVGLIITIGTWIGLIGNGRVWVLAYGPILVGLLFTLKGRADMKR